MKFTDEIIAEDEKRWHARDVVMELGYCSNNMRDRKNMTNLDIRFYAYIMRRAYEMLKAQEPRVIKVGDVRNWVNSDRITREPVVIEIRGGVCAWIIDDEVRELPGETNLSSDLYGKTWRCWTSWPSDEVRRATPWE